MQFKIIIDSISVNVNSNMSILQACESISVLIPRFCYHERLSIAGNCRMCLVEIENAPKLVASCSMPVLPNMVIYTNSFAVKKAREGVLEFLLVNHPLDCPICDQAGECDLQDQTLIFGSDRSRFKEYKRAVQDKNCSPIVKTIMTRCIHCMRCVRFANEIIGLPDLGTSGRGNVIEIGLYVKKIFKSEFSGNVIDLCPVGALTSKPYTFITRPWELKSIHSIDIFDGIGSNIRIDIRGYEIMRILPRLNEQINEEWISDKTRFAFDGLKRQRLYDPLIKDINGKFSITSWQKALTLIEERLGSIKAYKFGVSIGPHIDLESIFLLKYLVTKKNGLFVNLNNSNYNNLSDFQTGYRFNSTIKNIEQCDFCLLLGINPRIEGSMINLKLRKKFVSEQIKIVTFGATLNLTFPILNLGSATKNLIKFIEGKHKTSVFLAQSKKPLIIIGKAFFSIFNPIEIKTLLSILLKNTLIKTHNWNGLNFLNNRASDTGIHELGIQFKPIKNLKLSFLYCIETSNQHLLNCGPDMFLVYQGNQGNFNINNANLVLPSCAFTETTGTFVNIEGRYQKTKLALLPPGNAKANLNIIYAIIDKLKFGINFGSADMLYNKLFKFIPITNTKQIKASEFYIKDLSSKFIKKNSFLPATRIENFYLADNISKVSTTMAKCSKTILDKTAFL